MPELPEVETIVNQLSHKIVGKKVLKVEVKDSLADSKLKSLTPFKIKNVSRRAKYIIMALDNDRFILTHLGMTGQFFFISKKEVEEQKKEGRKFPYLLYQIVQFDFEDGSVLSHNNMRKFGSMKLLGEEELKKVLSKLGPEPLSNDFTLLKFQELLNKKPKANLKVTLMDQGFIAGIGNIYAQEALYHAGIDPHRKCGSLSSAEVRLLHDKVRLVLQEGIKHKGTSVENYFHLEGEGNNQKYLAVYGKEVCPKKHPLKKVSMGGRGTTYCPICQK
ncbi:MAG: bifunctional DNA-formamidopyrimidine glycosylase/DNA-(apurinic or apyrimidinic site) lyase [Candidatus Woesearchaeota archaeon]